MVIEQVSETVDFDAHDVIASHKTDKAGQVTSDVTACAIDPACFQGGLNVDAHLSCGDGQIEAVRATVETYCVELVEDRERRLTL